jgi:Na+-driven multidrug efflux pump
MNDVVDAPPAPIGRDAAPDEFQVDNVSSNAESDEHMRFGGERPIKTVLKLSVGPLVAQGAGSLLGIIDTIWVAHALGELALAAISTFSAFDGVGRAFGYWIGTAASAQIGSLFGSNDASKANQVFADMVRISLIFGVIIPIILWPSMPPIVRWFGASEEVVQSGMDYMVPLMICAFGSCLFMCVGGCLQGEGRTYLFAALNAGQLVLNVGIAEPILLLGVKTGISGVGISTAIAEILPALTLVGLFFTGHFTIKPTFKQLFQKFSPLTLPALGVGISQLVANLSQLLPSIVIRKFIGDAAGPEFNDAMAGYNVMVRLFVFTHSIVIAVTMGYLPAATYALAAKNTQRWLHLSLSCFWVTLAWSVLMMILTWSIPSYLAMMFEDASGYLHWAAPMIRTGNALGFCMHVRLVGGAMLQSLNMGTSSTVLSVVAHFVSLLLFATIFFFTDKHDGVRIMWSYSISYVCGALLAVGMLYIPVRQLWKAKGVDEAQLESALEDLVGASDGTSSDLEEHG